MHTDLLNGVFETEIWGIIAPSVSCRVAQSDKLSAPFLALEYCHTSSCTDATQNQAHLWQGRRIQLRTMERTKLVSGKDDATEGDVSDR